MGRKNKTRECAADTREDLRSELCGGKKEARPFVLPSNRRADRPGGSSLPSNRWADRPGGPYRPSVLPYKIGLTEF